MKAKLELEKQKAAPKRAETGNRADLIHRATASAEDDTMKFSVEPKIMVAPVIEKMISAQSNATALFDPKASHLKRLELARKLK